MRRVKRFLKGLRSSQPFNYVASSAVYFVASIAGRRPEFIIKHLPRVGLVKRKLPNGRILKFWSRGDDWVSNQVYWRGWSGYEAESSSLFFRLATSARVTLDIGAHIGFYALLAAHANPAGKVFAFEPLPDTYARLQRNVELNRLVNLHCVNSAVGEIEETAELFRPDSTIPCSAGLSFDFYSPWADEITSIKVPVVTVDGFVRGNMLDEIDLVKIDTESTEPQVLLGMRETLRRDHPVILCEVLKGFGSEKRLEEILSPLGYNYYLLTPDGPIPKDHIEGHTTWLNYLFTTLGTQQVAHL